jgi:MFS family permease
MHTRERTVHSLDHKETGSAESSPENHLLSRDGKLLLTWLLLNSIPIGFMDVVPLIYLLQVGVDAAVIGAIYAAGAIANTVGYIPFGILADKYGRKKFLVMGGFLPCISYAIFALTVDPYWLILASIIGGVGLAGGIGVAMNSPALLPLLANSTSDKNRTILFGISQGFWGLAVSIGAAMSILPSMLVATFGQSDILAHSISYWIMAGLVLASTIPALLVVERKTARSQTSSTIADTRESTLGILRRFRKSVGSLPIVSGKRIARFSLVFGLSGLGLGVIVQLLPTWYSLKFGAPEGIVGVWSALAQIISLIGIPLIPRLVRGRGSVITTTLTAVLSSCFLALMPLSDSFQLAASLFVVRTVLITISWPVLQSYMMGVVEERERATTIGITYTAWGLATSIGTYIGGALLGASYLTLPFVIGVLGYLASALILPLFFRKIVPPEELRKHPPIEPSEMKSL